MSKLDVNRREFLKITAGTCAAVAIPTPEQAVAPKMVGIQVGAISFVDEGTEKVLDVLQERACVNTLFLAVFTYGRGIAGRQIPGQPLPDHGKQEYDLNFHGGNFATPHLQYYKNTVLKVTRAPDHGDPVLLLDLAFEHGGAGENARPGLTERHGQGTVGKLGGKLGPHRVVFEILIEQPAQHGLLFGVKKALARERPGKTALEPRRLLLDREEAERAFTEQVTKRPHADVR